MHSKVKRGGGEGGKISVFLGIYGYGYGYLRDGGCFWSRALHEIIIDQVRSIVV